LPEPGTPLPEGSFPEVFLLFSLALLWCFFFALDFVWPWLEDFSGFDEVGDGEVPVVDVVVFVFEGEVEVEVEVVVVVVVVDEDDVLLGLLVVVVVVVVDELVVAAHVIDSATIGVVIGRLSCDSGVLGGTLTLNVSVTPPSRVTLTTHGSADARGIAAISRTTHRAPVSASTARTRRLMVKPCLSLQQSSASVSQKRGSSGASG
jgi:hypothetical protein